MRSRTPSSTSCIDHDELHEHSEELLDPAAEIGRLIFGASLGSTTLTTVLHDLDVRADELYKQGGSKQRVAVSLSKARELGRQARQIRVRSRYWEEAEHNLGQFDGDARRLRERLVTLRGEEDWLKRQILAMPLVAKRSHFGEEIAEIERGGAVQSRPWGVAVESAQLGLVTAGTERECAANARGALQERFGLLPAVSPLLVAGERIDVTVQGLGRFCKDVADLPGLRGQLTASRDRLAGLLERLGMSESDACAVTDAQLVVVDELAQALAALGERAQSAQDELDKLSEHIKHEERALRDLPQAPDVGELERVVAVARAFIERERQMSGALAELEGLAGDIRAGAKRLGLDAYGFEALEQLQTPEVSALRGQREQVQALNQRRAALAPRVQEIEERQSGLEARRAAILADSSVPSLEEVAAARARRDDGWHLVRGAWIDTNRDEQAIQAWAGDEALESAYEASVREADDRADDRFDNASQVANLAQIEIESIELATKRAQCEIDQRSIDEEAGRLDEVWSQLWAATDKCPLTVDQAEEWLSGLDAVRRLVADHRRRALTQQAAAADVESQRDSVLRCMSAGAKADDPQTLALAVEQADELISDAHKAADLRADAQRAIRQGKAEVPMRTKAVEVAQKALGSWRGEWGEALTPLRLAASTTPAAGRQAIALLREYREEQSKADTLRGRVDGLEEDIRGYKLAVEVLAGEVAPELRDFDPARVVSELKPMLDEARKESRVRAELLSQIEGAEAALSGADEAVGDARGELDRLRREAGLDAASDLVLEVQRATTHAGLKEHVHEVDDALISQGGGRTLKELLEALEDTGVSQGELQARLEDVTSEISQVDQELESVNRQYGDAQRILASLEHAGQAAVLEQDAELEFATLAENVSEYARVALAGEILRRVIGDYGERNQAPILKLAARNFGVLTDGAFIGLLADLDGDRQLLLAERQNGERLRVGELSEGTVDQLYLSGHPQAQRRGMSEEPFVLSPSLPRCERALGTILVAYSSFLGRGANGGVGMSEGDETKSVAVASPAEYVRMIARDFSRLITNASLPMPDANLSFVPSDFLEDDRGSVRNEWVSCKNSYEHAVKNRDSAKLRVVLARRLLPLRQEFPLSASLYYFEGLIHWRLDELESHGGRAETSGRSKSAEAVSQQSGQRGPHG